MIIYNYSKYYCCILNVNIEFALDIAFDADMALNDKYINKCINK